MNSIPTFRKACKITGFAYRHTDFIPDGYELSYAEKYIIPHMNSQKYSKMITDRNIRLARIATYYQRYPQFNVVIDGLEKATQDNWDTDMEIIDKLSKRG